MSEKRLMGRWRWLAVRLVVLLVTVVAGSGRVTGGPPPGLPDAPEHAYGAIPLDPATYEKYLQRTPDSVLSTLPSQYDARLDGIVTPVKDQGQCGSCWAFASVGAMEAHLAKFYGTGWTDLSEQQLLSCDQTQNGCDGGWSTAIRFWEAKGPIYESSLGYTASDTTPCPANWAIPQLPYRITNWGTVPITVNDIKASLYTRGPSWFSFRVYSDFLPWWRPLFGWWTTGYVYVNTSDSSDTNGGHAVLIIGWDDAKGAFLLKNSWGTGFGDAGPNWDGTFWMAYHGHAHDLGFQMVNFDVVPAHGDIIYVDAHAAANGDGKSWETAFRDLQSGFAVAEPGVAIWVAEGTYYPTAEQGGAGNRYKSFYMRKGVALYGGFDPSVGDTGWADRDWVANPTLLSGDIGLRGNASDNSYHVFYHWPELGVDASAILDGFTVSGGNANGGAEHGYGGGMLNWGNSSPAVANCTFSGNSAGYGGGMFNYNSSPAVTGCVFANNSTSVSGGGMHNWLSTPAVTNCTFSGNSAVTGGGIVNNNSSPAVTGCIFANNSTSGSGGGIHNWQSTPAVTNCTFSGNSATDGGGMLNNQSSPTLTNCILWGDSLPEIFDDTSSAPNVTYSAIQGGYSGTGNIAADPLFVNAIGGDYHLRLGSPCIDAGSDCHREACPTMTLRATPASRTEIGMGRLSLTWGPMSWSGQRRPACSFRFYGDSCQRVGDVVQDGASGALTRSPLFSRAR